VVNNKQVKHVVIVGGGSAGWLTAGLLASAHKAQMPDGLRISVVESPDVATIGVGEGTWPSMRNSLLQIGISEFDFIRQCHASFKQGSKFIGWKTNTGLDSYYHPFTTPTGYSEVDLYAGWRRSNSEQSFAHSIDVQSHLCDAFKAPKQFATPEYAGVTNYGYHLDAGQFSEMLKQHCIENLGVKYICDHIQQVVSDKQGYIDAIVGRQTGAIHGQLFIDCSGMASLLLGKHYHIPMLCQQHVLFNDSALAVQVDYEQAQQPIAATTLATAQDAGWIWDIGLSTRRGVGYTFASEHTTDEQVEIALANYLGMKDLDALQPRKLRFKPGYRQKFWHKNCLAIGMSAGFIEPLEASALAMVELSCNMLTDELPVNFEHMDMVAQRFNQRFSYRWQRVIEFLKLHYVLSQRDSSSFWLEHRRAETIPEHLQQLLALWRFQCPSRHDLIQNEEVFPSASYQYVLYGMDFDTQLRSLPCKVDDIQLAQKVFRQQQQKLQEYLQGLPSNREWLNNLKQRA